MCLWLVAFLLLSVYRDLRMSLVILLWSITRPEDLCGVRICSEYIVMLH